MRWFKKLLGRYDDYEECGSWGTFDTITGESLKSGTMYSRTIKVEREDGTVSLDFEWITDQDMAHEKATGEQVGPASDDPAPPDDPISSE
jgi:hypothetical protein